MLGTGRAGMSRRIQLGTLHKQKPQLLVQFPPSSISICIDDIFFMANSLELNEIRSNPIKEGLDPFRRLFELTRVDLGIVASSHTVQGVFSTAVRTGKFHSHVHSHGI